MKILITGKNGQVGYELERSLQGLGEIISLDRQQMDLADLDQVSQVMRAIRPDLIVNAAAYTSVDKAESEPELAMRINGEAPGVLAEEAKKTGAALIHYSTDYVFDGLKSGAYIESDLTNPVNTYGRTKLAGEQAIQSTGVSHLILRTSWVYGMRGKNFLLTMLRLGQGRDELRVVADQHGAPTWCRTIADTTAHIVAQANGSRRTRDWLQEHSNIYHLTAQGQTTWHGFAEAIFKHSSIVEQPLVTAIASHEYKLAAARPTNSVMSCKRLMDTFCDLPRWNEALKLCQS